MVALFHLGLVYWWPLSVSQHAQYKECGTNWSAAIMDVISHNCVLSQMICAKYILIVHIELIKNDIKISLEYNRKHEVIYCCFSGSPQNNNNVKQTRMYDGVFWQLLNLLFSSFKTDLENNKVVIIQGIKVDMSSVNCGFKQEKAVSLCVMRKWRFWWSIRTFKRLCWGSSVVFDFSVHYDFFSQHLDFWEFLFKNI